MIGFFFRSIFYALIFVFIFPHLNGVHFEGSFWQGVLCGAAFGLVGIGVSLLEQVFITLLGPLAVLVLLCTFWLIPAAELLAVAHFFPNLMSFDGFWSAFWASFVLFLVSVVCGVAMKATISD